jgi:two-component system phosphate regulon sensor histidine kinase PhoR
MRRNQIRIVVFLGAVSIMGIIAVQSYFLSQTWSIKEKQLIQTIEIALKNTALRFGKLNQTGIPARNPVHLISQDYFVVDINSVIDANILEFYLRSEFDKLNLHIDYEYGIYDCHTDRMVYGDYISAAGSNGVNKLNNELPKYSDYLYYFGIRFPALKSAIAADMTVWFFFTAILLLSIIFFVYALLVILRQKRWSEMQKDFMNNMTHEFKTPISSINLAAGVIINPSVIQQPERLQIYGTIIQEQNQRLNQLVDKVLEIAKIESTSITLTLELIDPLKLVQSFTGSFKNSLQKETSFVITSGNDTGLVYADVVHFTNVLYNLTDNAVKYGTDKPEIHIGLSKHKNHLYLRFSDNGPGIPKKYHNKVFHKFFRVPAGNTQNVKGFGLGLYYVKIICKSHKWKISLVDASPEPACFLIKIPLQTIR